MKHLRSFLLLPLAFAAVAPAADISVTAASVVASSSARFQDGIAGATLTAGQIVYADSSDSGKIKLADADASSATANVLGITAHGASAGQPIRVIIYDPSLTLNAVLSMSAPVYVLSGTAGGIAPVADLAAGDFPVVLLIATSTSTCFFDPVRGSADVE